MTGILCQDDINVVGHSLFKNYKLALSNYFQSVLQPINSIEDLNNLDLLIIVDEHYIPHKQVWQNDEFINVINKLNIKVLIFNFEKIFNSQFPWNISVQHCVEKINRRLQIVSDVKDAKILNTSIINKQFLSRDTILEEPIDNKIDEILFVGQINEYYPTRREILNGIQQINSKVRVIQSDRRYNYNEYLNLINQSKYILNPLGTGEFINLRFYEALNLGCTVIQQYTDEMEKWYPELNKYSVLKFKTVDDFKTLDFNKPTPHKELFLEDYFEEINFINIIEHI